MLYFASLSSYLIVYREHSVYWYCSISCISDSSLLL